jgi:hypothetical protein
VTRDLSRSLRPYVLAAVSVVLWTISDSSSAACLVKARQVDGVGTVQTLMLAPEREVEQYLLLGFSRAACPTDRSFVRDYVEKLCAGTGAVRAISPEALLGRRRDVACASARAGLAESGG